MAYTTIDDPSAYFHTLTYSGDSNDDRNITNDANAGNFKPDWLWIKERTSTSSHQLIDSTRGSSNALLSNTSDAEDVDANRIQAFQTNGFQVGTASTVNASGDTYVAWQWKANGGTTSSNSNGSITTTVQANTTAGFSIVTWTGTGSNATIGHGLGVVPQLIISKSRGHAENWAVYHHKSNTAPEDYYLALDDTRANTDSSVVWNDTAPTSSVISIGTQDKINKSSSTHIAYCFNEIKGYSKFGSYTGNGNSDGPFIYTGFKPALVIAKRTDGSGNDWRIADNKRDPFNIVDGRIKPNSSAAEDSSDQFDFLSNGFKLRTTAGDLNGTSGHTFVYFAFAEHPFVSSKGVPVTAR
jgi:hypothetical protein